MAAGLSSFLAQHAMIVSPAGRTPAAAPPDAEAAVATAEPSETKQKLHLTHDFARSRLLLSLICVGGCGGLKS